MKRKDRNNLRKLFPEGYEKARARKPEKSANGKSILPIIGLGIAALFGVGGVIFSYVNAQHLTADGSSIFSCSSVSVIDGDTFRCDGKRIRLYGIDAPELPGHCAKGRRCTPGDPYASTTNLKRLTGHHTTTCKKVDKDKYGRTVATCRAGGSDLSCGQIAGGFAVRRYGAISCPAN